jgi:hypothetical protein
LVHAWRRVAAALLVGGVTLALTETGIRLSGTVKHITMPSPVRFQAVPRNLRADGSTPESFVYQSGRHREVLVNAAGLRVLIIGGSAVHGDRYTPFTAFAGQLERGLNQALDKPVEVINLGTFGIAIRQVHALVEMAISVDRPDLVIVYSGNNEFYEMRVQKTIEPDFDSGVYLLRRRLFKSHLYRWLRWLLSPLTVRASERTLRQIDMSKLEETLWATTVDQDDRDLVHGFYAQELRAIVNTLKGAKVPLLLNTVANNTRWCPARGGSIPGSDDTAYSLCTEGNRLANAGQFAEAAAVLSEAELYSPRPFRSNRVQRQTVRDVAEATGTAVCDVDQALRATTTDGLPGDALFDDSCHPNPLGHQRIGRIMAECVLKQGLLGDVQTSEIPLPPVSDAASTVFRLDLWTGSANPHQTQRQSQADDTAESAAIAGHKAFIASQNDEALALYRLAIERGGPEPALRVSIAMAQLYGGDIASARVSLDHAMGGLSDEPNLRKLRATLEAHR